MFSRFRSSRIGRSLVVEINPYQILVVGINRQRKGPVVVESAAEFDRRDLAGLQVWLENRKEFRKRWMSVICGFVPLHGILMRETLRATDLQKPDGIVEMIREQHARRSSGSSAPFKELNPVQLVFQAVGATDGRALAADNSARPALLIGLLTHELHEVQQQLLDCRLLPRQLEPALLPLFGSLYQIMERRGYARAAVVFVIRDETTTVYILGKEGVHTPGPVGHGLNSIVQQVKKEFALESDEAALARLKNPDEELRRRARRLLRAIGAELRPMLDSYEMTTGQPIGDVYCPYLPPSLHWLVEPLVRVIDHEMLAVDCHEWMRPAGLETASGIPAFSPQWLGVLSLAGNLAGTAEVEGREASSDETERPWHVNCRQSIEPPRSRLVSRHFLWGAAAAALMIFTVALAAWQVYVIRSLEEDTGYWDREMASNKLVVDEMTASLAKLKTGGERLQHAHRIMGQPYQTTDLLMELGRLLPPRMRIDRIEANETRVLLTGSLQEPAEEASLSIGRYRETLRRAPALDGLFSSITATSLQRERDGDALYFEVTLRLNPPRP